MLIAKIRNNLAYKLVLFILLFSGFLTLIVTMIQLFIEYRRDVRYLDVQFSQIEKSFLKPLSSALWRYNEDLIMAQLEGISQFRDIEYAEVREGRKIVAATGETERQSEISAAYPITYEYKNEIRDLGQLRVFATYSGIYSRLYDRLLIVLASSAVKTFLTSFFLLALFQVLVMRHLKRIADYFRSYSLAEEAAPLKLDIPRVQNGNGDERHRIESEINSLIGRIRDSYEDAQKLVARRTFELEKTNEALKAEIRERKAAAEQVRISEAKFRNLIENSPDIVYRFSEDQGGVFVSRRVEDILGYPDDDIMETPFIWYESIHPDDKAAVDEAIRKAREGARSDIEYRIKDKAGRWHWFRDRFIGLAAAEKGFVIEGLATDITDRKMTERELKRSNQELEQFAYVASHDLQEPLRAIVGFLQLLESRYGDRLDDKGRHYIGRTVNAGHRMQHLINDLLTLSRVNTKGAPFEPTDLGQVAQEAMDNLQPMAQEKNGTILLLPPLPALSVDRGQIRRLFQNLIQNGLKYNQRPNPFVEVGVEGDRGEDYLFFVTDNGIGISPKFSERIFQVFQRLHSDREYPGTGLGLALCRKIVERHGGTIWVASEPGEGSTFYFTLPKRLEKQ